MRSRALRTEAAYLWVIAAILLTCLAVGDATAAAQDALICRKRDVQAGPGAQVHHLGPARDFFNAGPGSDVIYGGPGNDIINGGRGNDRVYGGPGRDVVCGGVGRDLVDGEDGADEVYGEEGDDTLRGGPGDDYMIGQAGKDKLLGYGVRNGKPVPDGRDFMEGTYRPDVLLVGGFDTAFGGEGNDELRSMTPEVGSNRLDGNLDADLILGSDDDDNLFGGGGRNRIFGLGGDDTIVGGEAMDVLFGGDDDDMIFGVGGRDLISGAAGQDFCKGLFLYLIDATCEQRVLSDAGEADVFARLEDAWRALAAVRASGEPATPSSVRAEIARAAGLAAGTELVVRFAPTQRDARDALDEVDTESDPGLMFLIAPGPAGNDPDHRVIAGGAFFANTNDVGNRYCLGETPPPNRDCRQPRRFPK